MPENYLRIVHINPVTLTVMFILLSAIVAAFIRGRKRDKCLKAFEGFKVTLEEADGRKISGRLRVESTGLEFVYVSPVTEEGQPLQRSFLMYKYEFGGIAAVIRYHDALEQANRKKRDKELERTYHPNAFRRFMRRLLNVFKTIRDSIMEVSNVLLAQAKKTTAAGAVLSSQDKYVTQMRNELIGSVETSYEPLLEKYIGRRVTADFLRQNVTLRLCGVLKDYTSEFIELLDVDYAAHEDSIRKADLILPRKRAVVRHLAE